MKNWIYCLIIISLSACTSEVTEKSEVTLSEQTDGTIHLNKAQLAQVEIVTDSLTYQKMAGTILLQGKVEAPPQNLISVSVPLGGYLKSTDLLPGVKVYKGQKLAILEDPEYIQLQQDYLLAKIKLQQLESEYTRQKDLVLTKAVSEKIYKQTEADYLIQQVLYKAMAEKLSLIGIKAEQLSDSNLSRTVVLNSPISGFVSKVNANIGKYLSPGEILFELVDVSDIHLSLQVYERDLQYISVGQSILAYTSHSPEKKYTGKVIAVGHSLDADKSTVVHCHFDSYDPLLVPGMFMRAEVEFQGDQVPSLLKEAIVESGGKQYIIEAISDSVFQKVEIKVGVQQNGYAELQSAEDLSNRRWVVKGAHWLRLKAENGGEE